MVALVGYLLNSAYYIFGQSSDSVQIVTSWILAVFYSFIMGSIIYNVVNNVTTLRRYSRTLLSEDMREIRRGILVKVVMYILFAVVICSYYAYYIFMLAILPTIVSTTDRQDEVLFGVKSLSCFCVLALVGIIFHPYFFTYSFQLGQLVSNYPNP